MPEEEPQPLVRKWLKTLLVVVVHAGRDRGLVDRHHLGLARRSIRRVGQHHHPYLSLYRTETGLDFLEGTGCRRTCEMYPFV